MKFCAACGAQLSAGSRFCPECGIELAPPVGPGPTRPAGPPAVDADAVTYDVVGEGRPAAKRPASASGVVVGGELVPGALLADRYRIVALLGRGGMGDVYRADDLKLAQPVALKFLPRALEHDAARLERFLAEIRTARDVSHPNVCRVYDVGDVDGRHFLSMEYIDGEDLASLLRRIGRLPSDKAIDIARQLCAGLAAAHDKGVLHRDLKPANVMLDGRGKVRLTDFGLAEMAGASSGSLAGTPTYMAPEQFAGQPASVQSDIYALGLVLYEVFTGKQVFTADSVAELRRLHEESRPASLTSAVHDTDPMVERVILRCLEKDPHNRPVSAIAVSAALPGGDPLAAALAAGETPSPDMVAAAGEQGAMRPAIAAIWLAAVVVGLIVAIVLAARIGLFPMLPLEYSPDVLASKAKEMLARLDVGARSAASATGLEWESGYTAYVQARDQSADRWKGLATGHLLFTFWYRGSPELMLPVSAGNLLFGGSGRVSPSDPAMTTPGMTSLALDARGRLLRLEVVPSQVEPVTAATPPDVNWSKLLTETGVDPATMVATRPAWLPATYADARSAWTGAYPDLPSVPLRIEAASYRGRPVYLRVVRPWTPPDRPDPTPQTVARTTNHLIEFLVVGLLLAGSALVARRNLLLGRGDRRGATRVAIVTGGLSFVTALLAASHVPSFEEMRMLTIMIANALFTAAWVGLLYLAIEPFLRRIWPHTLISWNRLLIGRFQDPLLGRDVLVGAAVGVALTLVALAAPLLGDRVGGAAITGLPNLSPLAGTRFVVNSLLAILFSTVFSILVLVFVLFVFRIILRRDWLAAAAFLALSSMQVALRGAPAADVLLNGLLLAAMIFVLLRVGLVAFGVTQFFVALLGLYPFAADLSSWQASSTLIAAAVLIAVPVFAFKAAVGGHALLGSALDR